MSNGHLIKRQKFQIQVSTRKSADFVFAQLGDLVKNRLAIVQADLFDELIPADQHLRIEQLTLDLGTISAKEFKRQLIERIDKALREAITKLLETKGLSATSEVKQPTKLTALKNYLQTGRFPWWMTQQATMTLQLLLTNLLEEEPLKLKELITGLLREQRVITRLKQQLSPTTFNELSQLIGPALIVNEKAAVSLKSQLKSINEQRLEEQNKMLPKFKAGLKQNSQLEQPTTDDEQLFIEYLKTGQLPAPLSGKSATEVEQQLRVLIKQASKRFQRKLVGLFQSTSFDHRIFQLLEWETVLTLGKWAWEQNWSIAANLLDDLSRLFDLNATLQLDRESIKREVIGNWIVQLLRDRTTTLLPEVSASIIARAVQKISGIDWVQHLEQAAKPAQQPGFTAGEKAAVSLKSQLKSINEQRLEEQNKMLLQFFGSAFSNLLSLAKLYQKQQEHKQKSGSIVKKTSTHATVEQFLLLQAFQELEENEAYLTSAKALAHQLLLKFKAGLKQNSQLDQRTIDDEQLFIEYLKTGQLPAPLSGKSAIEVEQQLRVLIKQASKRFQRKLVGLFQSTSFDQRIFQLLEWETVLTLGKWAWEQNWSIAANLLDDLSRLFDLNATLQLDRESIKREVIGNWIVQLLRDRTTTLLPEVSASIIARAVQKISGIDWVQHLKQAAKPAQLAEIKWKSKLFEALVSLAVEEKGADFQPPKNYRDLELLRFFLQRGYLPSSQAKNGLEKLEADLLSRLKAGGDDLYSLLAMLLQNDRSFSRFREEFSVAFHQSSLEQLIKNSNQTSGYPEFILFLPLLYPSAQLWELEISRYERYVYAGISRELLLSKELAMNHSPAAIIKNWADLVVNAAGIEWTDFTVYLEELLKTQADSLAATNNTTELKKLPGWILTALEQVASLGINTAKTATSEVANDLPTANFAKTPYRSTKNEPINETGTRSPGSTEKPNKNKAAEQAIEQLVAFLLNGKLSHETRLPPQAKAELIKSILQQKENHWQLFITSFRGKQINAERFYTYFSSAELQLLYQQLINERFANQSEETRQLKTLITQSGFYQDPTTAKEQFDRYLLQLLLVEAYPFYGFMEQLLRKIGRELQLKQSSIANTLLITAKAHEIGPIISSSLERIRASLSQQEAEQISQLIAEQTIIDLEEPRNKRTAKLVQRTLVYLLETGQSPWWNTESSSIDDLTQQLVTTDFPTFLSFLKSQKKLLPKLYPFLSSKTYEQVIRQRYGEFSDFIIAFIETADDAVPHVNPNQATSSTVQGPQIANFWPLAWEYTIKHEAFATETFLQFALYRLSLRTGLAADEVKTLLLTQINTQAVRHPIWFRLSTALVEIDLSYQAEPERQQETVLVTPATPLSDLSPQPVRNYATQLPEDFAAIYHFCYFGSPPLSQAKLSLLDLEKLQHRLLDLHPEVCIPFYRKLLRDRMAKERLFRFFSLPLWQKIGDKLYEKKMNWLEKTWADLEHLLPNVLHPFNQQDYKKATAQHLLIYAAKHVGSLQQTSYLEQLFTYLGDQRGVPLPTFFNRLKKALANSRASFNHDWQLMLEELRTFKTKQTEAQTNTSSMPNQAEESIYIHNAGLIILAAFLPRYFATLEMVEDRKLKDENAAIRGVQLLHYLATGQTTTPEHLMVLNKVLCGVDLNTPIPGQLELTEQEIEISNQLLNAVLQNWDKMSNSTIENLRGSFLLREGLINEHSDHWSMQVESAGYDIILSFLPWTISMVSLPWMEKRLETDWKTSIG